MLFINGQIQWAMLYMLIDMQYIQKYYILLSNRRATKCNFTALIACVLARGDAGVADIRIDRRHIDIILS